MRIFHGDLANTSAELKLRSYSASVVTEMAYGHQVVSDDDPYLHIADRLNSMIAGVGAQGSNMVDLFPICTPTTFFGV